MRVITFKRPSRTFLFRWTNGFMLSLFGFGLFLVHFHGFDWCEKRISWWRVKILTPFNTGKARISGDLQSYTYYEVELTDWDGRKTTVIAIPDH